MLASGLGVACGGTGVSDTSGTNSATTEGTTAGTDQPAPSAADPMAAPAASTDGTGQSTAALSCGATTWVQGKSYAAGDVVVYNGNYYVATNANPGYSPTISTWYWSPKAGCTTTTTTPSSGLGCGATTWVQGKSYAAGAVVFYNGSYYVATNANPGYSPTISTWYWSPKSGCTTSSTTPPTTGTTTGTTAFERIVSRATFDAIFPKRNAFYTYDGLVAAAKIYPAFASTGTVTQQKQEVAAFLANVTHETGALAYVEEIVKGPYCSSSSACPCASGQQYFGRGPMQLSWNDNYCNASKVIFGDANKLRLDPGLVARDARVAWGTGLWFWMTSNGAGRMTAHDAMVKSAGFGETIRTINGSLECNGRYPAGVTSRVNAYTRICSLLGVAPGANTTC